MGFPQRHAIPIQPGPTSIVALAPENPICIAVETLYVGVTTPWNEVVDDKQGVFQNELKRRVGVGRTGP
jgi:hypothetical protein